MKKPTQIGLIAAILLTSSVGMAWPGYDTQFVITENQVPSLEDLCTFREAIGLSTTYDSTAGIYTVTMDPFASGASGIPAIRVPEHNGEFADFETMDDFFSDLIGGFSCANPPEFPRPSLCSIANLRFDIRSDFVWINGSGVQVQDRHPFFGLLTNFDDVMSALAESIEIQFEKDYEQCATVGAGGGSHELVVTQCSEVRTVPNFQDTRDYCDFLEIPTSDTATFARNYFAEFKFDGQVTRLEDVGGGSLQVSLVEADLAELEHQFFQNASLVTFYPQFGIYPFGSSESNNGACAEGYVEKEGLAVQPETEAGFQVSCF